MNILQSSGIVSFDSYCYADVSSSFENAPFSNTTRTSNFQTQKAKGSYRPIVKVERGFVSEKSHFSFAVRESWKGR